MTAAITISTITIIIITVTTIITITIIITVIIIRIITTSIITITITVIISRLFSGTTAGGECVQSLLAVIKEAVAEAFAGQFQEVLNGLFVPMRVRHPILACKCFSCRFSVQDPSSYPRLSLIILEKLKAPVLM